MTLKRSGLTEKRTRLTMRTFKGLENIHSVIDKHIAEWRKEQGEPPEKPENISIEERVKRHLIEPEPVKPESKPRDPNRFINAELEHEEHAEPEKHEENENTEPEIISVIKQKEDEHHSWLYNEVLKAIKDAAGDGHNTKVIAVIVPVEYTHGESFFSLVTLLAALDAEEPTIISPLPRSVAKGAQ